MLGKLTGWNDTIVALATPQGIGAIGVIRISGANAIAITNQLFPAKNLEQQASHTLHVGLLQYKEEVLDEVVVAIFKGPRSYTGENVTEISCHGSPFIQERIIQAAVAMGCRIAKPGEFTQRAFLNGKLDLTQAEAVADLIASNTEASRNHALKNIRGGFSNTLKNLREELIKFSALIELELDFSQEDVEFADRTQLNTLLQTLQTTTKQLLQSFALGNVIKNGVQVAIIGKPNAGKSTLLNSLLNENRAIVSDIAGTTRDTIEEILNIEGILFRLIDTAGIRKHTADVIETIGVEKSLEKMQEADVVLYLFDIHSTSPTELSQIEEELKLNGRPYILVGNKLTADSAGIMQQFKNFTQIIFIAAKEGINMDVLKKALVAMATQDKQLNEGTVVSNARHVDALEKLYQSLQQIEEAVQQNVPGDLLAIDIRAALHYLGLITGEVTNEDQLDFIFSKFCIGK
ncbi:MAG: tRNA uridine-5-carboxymethylaminomethyl(34) synthesis GTPase MnmE [Chitinophagaceae bacterium]